MSSIQEGAQFFFEGLAVACVSVACDDTNNAYGEQLFLSPLQYLPVLTSSHAKGLPWPSTEIQN